MRNLTLDDFAPHRGKAHEILVNGGRLPAILEEVQGLPGGVRQGGAFRLVFRGPHQPVLPQGMYNIQRGSETYEMVFMVPIAQVQQGIQYEAIFM